MVILDGKRIKEIIPKGKLETFPYITKEENNDEEIELSNPVEIAEVLKVMNNDTMDHSTRMSNIDFNARLQGAEASAIVAYDTLIALRFLPKSAGFLTRKRMRVSVSEQGQGRQESVMIARGIIEGKQGGGLWDSFKGMFRKKEPQQ